ncbi:MAG: phosphoribosylamine--glycine ligase [Phycisphaerales bacterium]|jgi:phosphoribosylamine--glycine ligase|nr:phosphoribosylamine--glycine ligase [Phycisphaerales bacterium]
MPVRPPSCPSSCNILLVGGGGREHALAWRIRQSPRCGTLWLTDPGNAGLARLGKPCPHKWDPSNTFPLVNWCEKQGIDLVIVGPEQPLADGITDALRTERRQVFGPSAAGAQLEADKAFAKDLMKQAAIPTAESRTVETANAARRWILRGIEAELAEENIAEEAAPLVQWLGTSDDRGEVPMPDLGDRVRSLLAAREEPVVVKATGLAAGKGVIVCSTTLQALQAVDTIMVDKAFGDAGGRVIIEEFLQGTEVSVLALVDGRTMWVLDPCQDHKQVGEGDVGPNTGGMGAYCPAPLLDGPMLAEVERTILLPILDALRRRDIDYRGVLYAGLMLTPGGPKVLEFNCRFGDPECQPLMARLDGDLVDILWRTAVGTLVDADLSFDRRVACCVVLCSEGYPGPYEKGREISGLEGLEEDGLVVFHAGSTVNHEGKLVNTGGRVLSVTALADSLPAARERANAAIESIDLQGGFYRRDIGTRDGSGADASRVSERPATQ